MDSNSNSSNTDADTDANANINERNKGKQKSITFIIKFSDNTIPDLTLQGLFNVQQLRQQIRQNIGGTTTNRRLRLIYAGKVLTGETDIEKEVVKDKSRVYIHCSIGDILTNRELDQENELDGRVARSTLPELRGFDRLRNTGFSDEDIAQLRQQFNRIHGSTGNTDLEEEWIENGVQDPDTANALGGDYLDDLIGVLIGMFLGVFALFFFKFNIFPTRQKRAMMSGIALNFTFAALRSLM